MQRQDFSYELPDELIAHHPTPDRTGSRLLCLDGNTAEVSHQQFTDLLAYVNPGDLMIFNDTRVIPARLYGRKLSGGRVEILIERVLNSHQALAHIRASKSPKPGSQLVLDNEAVIDVTGREESLFALDFSPAINDEYSDIFAILDAVGHMPLPPYITREDAVSDQERYQTVYGREAGAVAAPTAGLHFDEAMLEALAAHGVDIGYVTLHVGAGTFQPVRVDDIREHQMHSEVMSVDQAVCDKVNQAKAQGRRVIAVGTTSVRCLESAAAQCTPEQPLIKPYQGETRIFIYPGFNYKVVDALLTNFHLPESTLLMLVSAFAGYDNVMKAYHIAVAERYRFFSYGDAMFITRRTQTG